MTAEQIITKFELRVDDTTELSTDDELELLNEHYQLLADKRPWEILKKEASGVMVSTTEIGDAPSDFKFLVENRNYTDNSIENEDNSRPVGILINASTTPKWLRVINWGDRRQYTNSDGFAYYDPTDNKFKTTYPQPTGATYSYDYKSKPAPLLINDSPVFPEEYHQVLALMMAVDDMSIQLFDKARSYARENEARITDYLQRMAMWNANLLNM